MPAIAKTDQFLELVRKSRLVDEKKLDAFLQRHQATAGEDSPVPLATKMVQEAVLSTFQAKQLLQGRWRRFIINNKYKVLEMLGQGGMGSVYLCEQFLMRRLVALKMLPEEKLQQPGALERFMREARAVATLDHPNIVHAYDMDKDEHGMHFMVMEYVDGVSLEVLVSKLYKNKGLDPLRAAHYISQAALGLQHAHELGWVHRDIKPANLLLDRQGIIKILDMGLSRAFGDDEEELTKKYDGSSVLGTADYIAPEQALHVSAVDIRADIYSLGATFYFLLTGRAPFEKGTVTQKLMFHQIKDPDPVTQLRPEVPPEMGEVVAIMMAKNPDHRFQVPAAVVEALAPWTQTPIPAPPEREMPALCPLVRELSPTSSGSKSSGSWSTRVASGAFVAPGQSGIRTPLTGSGRIIVPQSPTAETVSDSAERGRALTPKSLPRLASQSKKTDTPSAVVGKPKLSPKVLAIGAVSFLALVISLVALVLYWAFSGNSKDKNFGMVLDVTKGVDVSAEPVLSAPQARNSVGRRVYVEFVVRSVSQRSARGSEGPAVFFLNSEPPDRREEDDNFLVVIPASMLAPFLETHKINDLLDLVDCKCKVHGMVEWYMSSGPRLASMQLQSPQQLEIIARQPGAASKAISPAQAASRVGQKATVEFTVESVVRVSSVGRTYLMSTKPGQPRVFAAAIREEIEHALLQRLGVASLEELEGKRLIVSGKVDLYEGKPFIDVTDIEQVRLSTRVNITPESPPTVPTPAPKVEPSSGPVLKPEEARTQIGKDVVVEFVVVSTGRATSRTRLFLNSMADYKDPENFAVVLPGSQEQQICERLGIQTFDELKGKKVRVKGRVTLYMERPQIELSSVTGVELAE